jgi:hypothetical protein
LVTYGDIWRNTLEELPVVPGENQLNLTIDDKFTPEHEGVSITGIAGMAADFEEIDRRNGSSLQAVVRPVRKAATVMGAVAAGAAANIWESLTKGPSEDEAQENLRKWAKAKGGAVLPPMEEGELDNEVRFVGLFPELVGQMMETTLDEESELEEEGEAKPEAGPVA